MATSLTTVSFWTLLSPKNGFLIWYFTHQSPSSSTSMSYLIFNPKFAILLQHIEVLVSLTSQRYAQTLATERSTFVFPWFANALQGKFNRFTIAKNKHRVRWSEQIRRFISAPQLEWFVEVDTIYLPMIWDDSHWVGLVIHLENWLVEILDPNVGLYCDRKVERFIAPVVQMLPYIINKFCKHEPSQSRGLKPFVWKRDKDMYENKRSGDCGPLAIKLLEMHCTGCTSDHFLKITDSVVDNIRKQFALDVYERFVVPIYREDK